MAIIICNTTMIYGQANDKKLLPGDSIKEIDIFSLNLEELMNVKIISASKKSETVFDAPLSVGSVSRDEIKRSGATSIMEALRLVPGLIVRETTQGNYDIHIRGFDNLPYISSLNSASNTISLVMIDNRPVYNYLNGGTFWETLPIDINDVDKIEVVRGPSSALYGPNAAAGVINILTRRAEKEGMFLVANAQAGTLKALISNLSVGYKTGKFQFNVSGNQQYRERTETNYYSWLQDKKVSADSILGYYPPDYLRDLKGNLNANERYPNRNLALSKYGLNGFLNYDINDKSSIGISLGTQKSQNQRTFTETLASPITNAESNTYYADARLKLNKLSAQVSYNDGTQNAATGVSGDKYDFKTVDAFAEYDFTYKNLSLKPGLNYRNANYDDSKYYKNQEGFINGSYDLNNIAGSIRSELRLVNESLKFTGAFRVDKYNNTNKIYPSYQLGANFKIDDNNLLRTVYSRAFRGPSFLEIYTHQSLAIGPQDIPGIPFKINSFALIQGNKNINLLNIDMYELGYRMKASENLYFDADVFYQIGKNFSNFVTDKFEFNLENPSTGPLPTDTKTYINITTAVVNMPLTARQLGVTISANYAVNKFQIKPFITIQETQLKNASRVSNSENWDPNMNFKNVLYDTVHASTPSVYGGFYANYSLAGKWNINTNAYFFSANTYSDISNTILKPYGSNYGKAKADAKLLLNLKVSYKVAKSFEVFVNAKNVFNKTSFEFAHADITKFGLLVGGNFEF
jgi:iron complex outermembrane receptor protein